ncbi:MAG: NAD-dependent epimerase/dehydratase family protein [Candidatus Eisenbacteria bacterium]|nr:NAD-dependent epimerase/dehydratase family protein [Candidatus Eisenbacteria bacterium]
MARLRCPPAAAHHRLPHRPGGRRFPFQLRARQARTGLPTAGGAGRGPAAHGGLVARGGAAVSASDRVPASPVLVTGANGFIGQALCAGLLRAGCTVRGAVLRGTDAEPLERMGIPVYPGDILQPETLAPALQGVRSVYHLAALATDWAPWDRFMRVNAEGTACVLEAARRAGVQRLVHMSSLVVHPFSGHVAADEHAPLGNRTNGYCAAKGVAEGHVRRAQQAGWFETVIIRPGTVIYGPGDTTAFVHLAPALERGPLPLVGDGETVTCCSYVGNLVDGLLLAGHRPEAAGRSYVLTDDRMVTWRAYLSAVCSALGVRPRLIGVPTWMVRAAGWSLETIWRSAGFSHAPVVHRYRVALMARDFHFGCERAKRELGYRPRVGLESGLARTVEWYRRWQVAAGRA